MTNTGQNLTELGLKSDLGAFRSEFWEKFDLGNLDKHGILQFGQKVGQIRSNFKLHGSIEGCACFFINLY